MILTKLLISFTEFATFLLHNPSFTWTISTSKLQLTALGTIFNNVSLSKDVSFKAFNGLPGVTISNFQLPSDDPAGGIHIETDASIPSPSRLWTIIFFMTDDFTKWYGIELGINLGTVTFQSFFQSTLVGRKTTFSVFLIDLTESEQPSLRTIWS